MVPPRLFVQFSELVIRALHVSWQSSGVSTQLKEAIDIDFNESDLIYLVTPPSARAFDTNSVFMKPICRIGC